MKSEEWKLAELIGGWSESPMKLALMGGRQVFVERIAVRFRKGLIAGAYTGWDDPINWRGVRLARLEAACWPLVPAEAAAWVLATAAEDIQRLALQNRSEGSCLQERLRAMAAWSLAYEARLVAARRWHAPLDSIFEPPKPKRRRTARSGARA